MTFAKRMAIAVVGLALVLAGVVLLVLPGPGLLLVLAGIVVLASEFAWAERLLHPVRERAWQAMRSSVQGRLRIAGSVATGAVLVGAGVLWMVVPELPFGRFSTGSSLVLSGLALWGLLVYSYRRVRRGERSQPAAPTPR